MIEANYIETNINRCKDVVELVFGLTEKEGFIAGGFARYCLSINRNPILPNDIDIFCQSEEVYNRILNRFKDNDNLKQIHVSEIEVKFEYKLKSGFLKEVYNIQLIKPTEIMNMVSMGDYKKVLDNFDFTIAKCAITPDMKGFCHPDFYEHDGLNQLTITNIHCPISSLKRAMKYCKRGYSISSQELLKLFEDYEKRDQSWKDIVKMGLSNAEMDDDDRKKFIQTMYFD